MALELNFATSKFVSADEIEARRQCARWLGAIADCDVPMDDDYFAFVGWIYGGLDKFARLLQENLVPPKGRTKEAIRAREALADLSLSHPMRLDDHIADLYTENPVYQKPIRLLLQELAAKYGREEFSVKNVSFLKRLQTIFGLGQTELEICYMTFLLSQYRPVDRFLEDSLEIHSHRRRHLFGQMLGKSGAEVFSMVKELEAMGVTQNHHGSLRLTDNVETALLLPEDMEAQDIFCRQVPQTKVKLDQFFLEEEQISFALKLMGRKGSAPTHLLLYGAPGCGKSTFASSLIQKLKVKAWMVPCGENDDVQDRRASLSACLRLASAHDKAIVVVDEAERILDTSTGDLETGSSKAWVNALLERENTRVIWITNRVSHMDRAVRRRFSYSICFYSPDAKVRKQMWDSVVKRLHMGRMVDNELREHLARTYDVPIATMEMALREARSLEKGKNIAQMLDTILVSQMTLLGDGLTPRKPNGNKRPFDPRGVCVATDVNAFLANAKKMAQKLESLQQPGQGNMLFYGPPGTGKTALARHLADELEKTLLIRRASDILGPYVGQTEMLLAAAFSEAEQKKAILLIDEVDTFLYSRDRASRSWEQSMTNEFLTCLESFTGICVCTTNFRSNLDNGAMRRFSVKLEFTYARPEHLVVLYKTILQPLVGEEPDEKILRELKRQKCLAPGDFAAVSQRVWMEDNITHEYLLRELIREQRLKLDAESKTVGF